MVCERQRVIRKSLQDFRRLRYSSWDGHAERDHVNRGRHSRTWRDSLPIDVLLSAVSVLVVAQPSSEVQEMHMSYWFGTAVGDLLFRGFTIKSASALVWTCLGLASLAILYEAIKVYLAHIKYNRVLQDEDCHSSRCTNERSSLLGNVGKRRVPYSHKLLILCHETGWYMVQDVLSYILMLCVMTYNGYFTIAVCLGAGIGYLVFGPVLIEIGMRNGGLRPPKRFCRVCMEATSSVEDVQQAHSSLSDVAEQDSLVHQSDQGQCHESVAVVHRTDNEEQSDQIIS